MAFYQLQPSKNTKKSKDKKIGLILLIICSVSFLFLFTSLVPFMKNFLLGVFGLFAYPLFLTLFFISIALINQKKYVMPKKYLTYFLLVLTFLLCLVQLMILGKPEVNFFGYFAKTYTFSFTAGGVLISLLTAPIIYIFDLLAGYIFFTISLIIAVALLADYIFYLNKNKTLKKPLSISNNLKPEMIKKKTVKKFEEEKEVKSDVKITLDHHLESLQKEENQAKIRLGLLAGTDLKTTKKQAEKPDDVYKYILTTPDVDMSIYNTIRQNNKEKLNSAFNDLKNLDEKVDISTSKIEKVIHDQMPEFIMQSEKNLDNKKVFLEPIHNFIDSELEKVSEEELSNDKADEILKNILDIDKPVEIEVDPISPKLSRRRFVQGEIDGTQKPQKEEKERKTYSKPPVYIKPPIDILKTVVSDMSSINQDVIEKRIQLESALELFKIPAKVIGVVAGPAVTRYEIEMPPGISVKKIVAHSDDIALALASKGDIRIEAPIPGKSAVGIEVPNEKISVVGIKEILSSQTFLAAKEPLTLALGKDINGEIKICNLQKMPHLLVAGATNSGKSVCLNSIIISLMYKTSPDDLKIILIDPKRVEFSQYNNLPHLLIPNVIVDADKAINAFSWAIDEMERRFHVLMDARVRNIDEYNNSKEVKQNKAEKMPFIVIVVDELADLMSISKKEAEEKIMRLAQKARACGIHLILATQRPSVDVITGTIKANFPSRISFAVTSFQDSRTILDQGGAEKLLGRGDMLYAPSDVAEPIRIQGCFVSTKEVQEVVDFIKENNEIDYDSDVEDSIMSAKSNMFSVEDQKAKSGFDPLMQEALQVIIESGQASISMLQRKLVIGFPRAARIIDQMEASGYISPSDGSKPRTVFITQEELDEMFQDEN